MKIVYVGNFTQPHCTEVHVAATLESMGHEVVRLQENAPNLGGYINGRAIDVALVIRPDLFLWTRTWTGHVTTDDLKLMEAAGIPTVSYHLDLYVGLKREDGLDTDPFWRTRYVFTPDGDPASAEIFKAKGINHHYLKPGVFKDECQPGTFREEFAQDVVFVGGGSAYSHVEWPYRMQLINWLTDTYGDRFGKYGNPERTVRNQELNDLYASAKIVVGDSLCPGFNKPMYTSDRIYETVGRGGFTIFPYIKGLEEEFTDGETIVFYEYGNFDQLREKIDYYLEHDDERLRIQKAGQEFVREHATYTDRLQQMLDIVFPTSGMDVAAEGLQQAADSIVGLLRAPLRLNLGCGSEPTPSFVNVDRLDLPGVDIVHNLLRFPYPFEDESAEYIKAIDVLEHLPNYTPDEVPTAIAFVEECHRILKPGGELFIQVPHWRSPNCWIDVTHVRGFDERSMEYFDPETDLGKAYGYYSPCKFGVTAEVTPNLNVVFRMVKR